MDGVPSSKVMRDLLGSFRKAGINDARILDTSNVTQEIGFRKDADNRLLFEVGGRGRVSGFSTIDGVDNPVDSFALAEQEIRLFAHDVGTGPGHWRDCSNFRYLSLTDMANRLGIRTQVLMGYRLPFPDVYVGNSRGWSERTFEKWRKRHPRVGDGFDGKAPLPPTESQRRGRTRKRRKYEW